MADPRGFFSAMRDRWRQQERDERYAAFMQPLEAASHRRGGHSSRLLLYALCLTFFLLLLWAAFANIEETVTGIGQVMTSQRVQHIQHLEGGIVREIAVKEGDTVEKGALLLRVDNEQAGSVYRDVLTKSLELEAILARLEAEITGKDAIYPAQLAAKAPDAVARHASLLEARRTKNATERKTLEAQLELRKLEEQELLARKNSLTESLAIAQQQLDMAKKLMATRSYSRMEYLNLAQQVSQLKGELDILASSIPKTQASVREAGEKLALHASDLKTRLLQEKNEASSELAAVREGIAAGGDRAARAEILSPVHGVVKSVNVTTEGGVVMPGQTIMDIVPSDEPLIIEARISPQDRAFLFTGQKAKIRISAYDFTVYGSLDATLEYIGADTVEGRQGEVFYKAGLRTKESFLLHNGRQYPILPGMMATADIITGKRTVLQYILKPIFKARQVALRER